MVRASISPLKMPGLSGVLVDFFRRPYTQKQLVDFICPVLCALCIIYGSLFYLLSGNSQIMLTSLTEACLFGFLSALSKQGYYRTTAILLVLVNNVAMVYFSGILGKHIEMYCLIPFFIGMLYVMFDRAFDLWLCSITSLLSVAICEVNFLYGFIPAVITNPITLTYTRWLALPLILSLDVLMFVLAMQKMLAKKAAQIAEPLHELRNPLNAAYGIAMTMKEAKTTTQVQEQVDHLLSVVKICTNTVNQTLDAGLQGNIIISKEAVPVKDFFHTLLSIQQYVATGRNIHIDQEIDMPSVILIDKEKVTKIYNNFISNAIKFSPFSGIIHVSIRQEESFWFLEVVDAGKGMTGKELQLAFQPYYSKGGASRGTGLGLPISKRIVEAMGGHIELSTGRTAGTKITAFFPLEIAHPSITFTKENIDLSGCRVLYIEDDKLNQKYVGGFLQKNNAALVIACDAPAGLIVARNVIPDIIVLDMNTSVDISGMDTIKLLKASDDTRHIPIIALSGTGDADFIRSAMEAGAEAFFVKTAFSYRELVKKIDELRHRTSENYEQAE